MDAQHTGQGRRNSKHAACRHFALLPFHAQHGLRCYCLAHAYIPSLPVTVAPAGSAACAVLYRACLAHSGFVAGLGYLMEDVMVTSCWTGSNLEGFIKTIKFVELSAIDMFAVTNLVICANLALIVSVSNETS